MTGSRILKILAVLLGILFLILGLLLWASYSPAASQRIMQEVTGLVPELSLDYRDGSLARGLALDIRYQDEDIDLALINTQVHIRPACLWQLSLCVRSLHLDSISVSVPAGEADTGDSSPIELPSIAFPVPIVVDQLSVDSLLINYDESTVYAAHNINLSAEIILYKVSAQSLTMEDEYCQWSGNATIRLTRRYPIEADLQCTTSLYPLSLLHVAASGDLDNLAINSTSEGELKASLDLEMALLDDDLPLSFSARLTDAYHYQLEEESLTISEASLSGEGDLNLIRVQAESALSSPLFPSPIATSLQGDLTFDGVQLQHWLVRLPKGEIDTQGTVSFTPELSWQAQSQLSAVAFDQFYKEADGNVTGTVTHSGALRDDTLLLELNLEQLAGVLYDTPWQMLGNVNIEGQSINLQNIKLTQDQNQVQAHGAIVLNGDSDINLDLNIRKLQQLLPELSGTVAAKLALRGSLKIPAVKGTIQASNLHYQDMRLSQANVDVDWELAAAHKNRIVLNFEALQLAEQVVLRGNVNARGDAQQHLINLSLEEQEGNRLNLSCTGKFNVNQGQILVDQWQAICDRSNLQVAYLDPVQNWTLQQPLKLQLEPDLRFRISPFCYGYQDGKLCLQDTVLINQDHISPVQLQGNKLYLSWLNPWLPGGMTLTGNVALNSKLVVGTSIEMSADVVSKNTTLTLFEQDENPVRIPFKQINISAKMQDEDASLGWNINSSFGNTEGTITLDSAQERLGGYLNVAQLNLAPFSPYLLSDDGDHISGVIDGQFTLGGSLSAPLLEGKAQLSAGEIETAMLPLPIRNIGIQLTTKDRIAELQGQFTVNKNPGHLQGTFNWQQAAWWSKISFHSDTLAYRPDDNILVYVKPDIDFNLSPNELNITGDVFVPKARIHLKSLPETAVSVSSDTIIVDAEDNENENLNISTQLKLTLGDDVRFKGYGLETDVTGQMTIRQHQSDLLRAKGIIRLENGTYQAYGQSLTITDGDLIFIDDLENPQLRISATRNNISDNVVVGVRATGRAQNPDITIYSIPEMPEQEKFHYLITGRAPNTEATSGSVAAEAALSMALESRGGFTRKAGEKLGIQDLTLSAGSTENRSEVGLSGYITPDLMIRYGVGMFEAINTFTVKYRIKKDVYAEVISGKSNAFDILWSFDRD